MLIEPTLYRGLYDEALSIVRAVAPHLVEQALAAKKDPAAAVGDAIDEIFRRVLEGFEKHQDFLEPPDKRGTTGSAAPQKRGGVKPKKSQWDPFV